MKTRPAAPSRLRPHPGPTEAERAQRRRTAAVVGLGLSLGAALAFLGALLQPRRRADVYDPRRPR